MYMYMCIHICIYNTTKTFHPRKMLLQVSNTSKGCVGELSTFCDSTSGVCRYMSSQVNGIHVCICAFSMYVGGQYAFGAVPGGVSNNKKTPVHQQTWIVPALVGDVSFVVSDV